MSMYPRFGPRFANLTHNLGPFQLQNRPTINAKPSLFVLSGQATTPGAVAGFEYLFVFTWTAHHGHNILLINGFRILGILFSPQSD